MRVIFGSVKYLFKNVWYVLPFAILPAVFLTLSVSFDYSLVHIYVTQFFTGNPRLHFLDFLNMWSLVSFDSLLGAIYSACAFLCIVACASLMFPLIEKHMRIGRRSLTGLHSGFKNALAPVLLIGLLYVLIYEVFAIVLSSLLFAVSEIPNTPVVYILSVLVYAFMFFVLFYVAAAIYLWLPCKLITGFSAYDSFRYSYRLAVGERAKLLTAFALFTFIAVAVFALAALLPAIVWYIAAFVLFLFVFLDFCIRMETVYFKADKLDREDIIHTFKEY